MWISCRRASELVSEGMERPLTLMERISLKIHELICPPCVECDKQLHDLHTIVSHMDEHISDNGHEGPCLSDQARKSIEIAVQQEK